MDTKSKRILSTCDARLIHLFTDVAEARDIKVDAGFRTAEEQFELYKKGRELIDGIYQITGKTVTNCDGYEVLSNHQSYPSNAVDVWPLPLRWDDLFVWREFADFVYSRAEALEIKVRNLGQSYGDWPHWEVLNGGK